MESNVFKYQHSILLYLVYEGWKCEEINEDQKIIMKQLIIERNPIIYSLLKNYQREGNPIKFWNSFKEFIARNELNIFARILDKDGKDTEGFETEKINFMDSSTTCDQLSSPSDAALVRQKKKKITRQVEREFKEKSEEYMKESHSWVGRSPRSPKTIVQFCQEGQSPKIVVLKKFDEDQH
jgi:hypothetical protein